MPHSLVMQRTNEHEVSEEFVELALGPPIFLDKQLEGLTIGEMAQFDQLSPTRPTQ